MVESSTNQIRVQHSQSWREGTCREEGKREQRGWNFTPNETLSSAPK